MPEQAGGARGHLPSPAPRARLRGLCFFAVRGGQRESVLLCFSHSSPACPKPLCRSLVSLAFSLCLALCPQEPTQL